MTHDTGRFVQIPKELFSALVKYHLFNQQDPEMEAIIITGLTKKLDAAAARETYLKQKLNSSP